ncbi:MAG: carboxylating nicotinate-nucleotide diphosphorylase [Bacteroidales bacterium]
MNNEAYLQRFIQQALEEDVAEGDHSTLSCIPAQAQGEAQLFAKEEGIIAGLSIAQHIFHMLDKQMIFNPLCKDGDPISPGQEIFTIKGSIHAILKGERLMLNILQRMSGIATNTHKYASKIKNYPTQILDTRKTTPNMRYFEKMAVRIGGGTNHRMGLYDMIMLKDNHIDFAGGIKEAIQKANVYRKDLPKQIPIEVEVRNFEELEQVLAIGHVDRIMLDNFTPEQTREAVKKVNHQFQVESSGGITFETLENYAACGVDFISVGALTHQIKSLDLSLKAKVIKC